MEDVVVEWISGVIIIMTSAVFYVLWDNSCNKFREFENRFKTVLNSQSLWMDAVEDELSEVHGINLYHIKQCREDFDKHQKEMNICIKRP